MRKKMVYLNLAAEMGRTRTTQRELGKLIGTNHVGVHQRLYGLTEWKLSEICKVMNYFNLGFEYLFERTD